MRLEEALALARQREAMERYGITGADLGHVTNGGPCWCGGPRQCATCRTAAQCYHGAERLERVIHRRSN